MTLSDEAADFGITEVPDFRWLMISGRPGEDDFGVLGNGQAVISEGALQARTLDNCEMEPYSA